MPELKPHLFGRLRTNGWYSVLSELLYPSKYDTSDSILMYKGVLFNRNMKCDKNITIGLRALSLLFATAVRRNRLG